MDFDVIDCNYEILYICPTDTGENSEKNSKEQQLFTLNRLWFITAVQYEYNNFELINI
jgi:hypothetical protein